MLVKQTTELLTQLRDLLQEHELWEAEPPAPERLLEFHQWLQFIMIPQFEHRIEHNLALPRGFAVSPMAEECWRGCWGERRQLILTLREFDELFS